MVPSGWATLRATTSLMAMNTAAGVQGIGWGPGGAATIVMTAAAAAARTYRVNRIPIGPRRPPGRRRRFRIDHEAIDWGRRVSRAVVISRPQHELPGASRIARFEPTPKRAADAPHPVREPDRHDHRIL